jgi:hypothetical protein
LYSPLKTICSSRNPRRFGGVQRRGPVKDAVSPRSSQTLDREHRWKNAGFEWARGEWGKNGEENVFGQEHRMEEVVYCSRCTEAQRAQMTSMGLAAKQGFAMLGWSFGLLLASVKASLLDDLGPVHEVKKCDSTIA